MKILGTSVLSYEAGLRLILCYHVTNKMIAEGGFNIVYELRIQMKYSSCIFLCQYIEVFLVYSCAN